MTMNCNGRTRPRTDAAVLHASFVAIPGERGEARIKALAKSKERPTLKIEGRGTRNGHDNYKDKGNHDGNCDDGGILRCARMTANVYGNVYVNVYHSGYG
jgi:hypothetical protein